MKLVSGGDAISKAAQGIMLAVSACIVIGIVVATTASGDAPAKAISHAPTAAEVKLARDCAATMHKAGVGLGVYRYETYSDGAAVVDVTEKFQRLPLAERVQLARAMQCIGTGGRPLAADPAASVVFQDYRTHSELARFDLREGLAAK